MSIREQRTVSSQQATFKWIDESALLAKVLSGEPLDPEELAKAHLFFRAAYRGWESYVEQRAYGLFDDTEWQGVRSSIRTVSPVACRAAIPGGAPLRVLRPAAVARRRAHGPRKRGDVTERDARSVTIRAAQTADAAALSSLAVRSKAHWGYPPEFMARCRDELRVSPDDIDGGVTTYVVAECDGRIVGFAGTTRIDDARVELEALFVDPPAIGTGVGRMLLTHAAATGRALGATTMLIQGDPNANRFYLAAGALPAGTRASDSIDGRALPLYVLRL